MPTIAAHQVLAGAPSWDVPVFGSCQCCQPVLWLIYVQVKFGICFPMSPEEWSLCRHMGGPHGLCHPNMLSL